MNLMVGTKLRLLKDEIFRDSQDNEIPVPAGTMGAVVAIDKRQSVTIYEVHMDNGTFVLYCPEEDGPDYMEVQ